MTRFARAKGAAASNERVEEEATPWQQMAQQMRSATGYEGGDQNQHNRDVEDLNGDMEIPSDEDDAPNNLSEQHDRALPVKPHEEGSSSDETGDGDTEDVSGLLASTVKNVTSNNEHTQAHQENDNGLKIKRQRKQSKCLNCKEKGHLKRDCPKLTEERRKELQELIEMKIERKGKGTGRKKNKKRKQLEQNGDGDECFATKDKRPKNETSSETLQTHKMVTTQKSDNRPKHGDNALNKHKKVLTDKTGQVVGAGEGLFQGFRVKEQDVKRLQKLQRQLRSDKTLKEDDMNATLKRERRKAERELATFHKMVCYNCRKPGHLLVDCPDTKPSEVEKKSRQV